MRWFLIFIIILLLLLAAYIAWIGFTHYRARRSGLPPPPLKSYIPFTSSSSSSYYHRDSSYPTPRPGGVGDWFRDKWAAVRNRRTARGAYESPLHPGAGSRGGGGGGTGYAHDEIWDSRIGEGGYGGAGAGYYEEQELGMGRHGEGSGGRGGGGSGPYDMGGRVEAGARVVPAASTVTVDLHAREPEQEVERGRSRSREPPSYSRPAGGVNPFSDAAETSQLRDVSSRPAVGDEQPTAAGSSGGDGTGAGAGAVAAAAADDDRGRSSDRKSVFKESI
ncbi:hypothetical protein, variant [Blastomyces dermatitidis ATCC 26199]|nr:hypothetical protein BDFG_06625 [Blastomyces dermatitidis ATCC 26199]EQL30994.1 hypothetical protein, variant [Blastomyces dermatitidis ATCC 26199]